MAVKAKKVRCSVLSGVRIHLYVIQMDALLDGALTAAGMNAVWKGSLASGKNGKEYFAFE